MSHEYYYESVQKQQHLEEEVKHLEREMEYLLWEKTSVENQITELQELINKAKERL
jgi:peptidoglycan hydrolase CwlO-like protein